MAEIKPFLTYDEQVEHLIKKGLIVTDKNFAKETLSDINYYRMIDAYSLGLIDKSTDTYKENTSFEDILGLYLFDIELRHIMSELLEEFEITFRTKVAYFIGQKYGPLGYLDKNNFEDEEHFNEFIDAFNREKDYQKKSPIIKHHNDVYGGQLPIWACVEVLSFGTISKMFSNLKKEDKDIVVFDFGATLFYFESWLRSFVEVRNICAHYGRLYNKLLLAPPKIYKTMKYTNNRIFAVLVLLKKYCPKEKWTVCFNRLKKALLKYNSVDSYKMGFPLDWQIYLEK